MTSTMKKLIIALASLVTVLLGIAVIIPVIFKDEIQSGIQKVLNDNLEARIQLNPANIDMSLFRDFPNPTVSIDELGIFGVNQFAGDTLMYTDQFMLTLDLFSLFGDTYTIKSINLKRPTIHVVVLESGNANYEIVVEADTAQQAESAAAEFNLSINQWTISEGRFVYDDRSMGYHMLLEGISSYRWWRSFLVYF